MHAHKNHYKNISIKKLAGSEIEIVGEIEKDELENARKTALKKLAEEVHIDGFRKGKIPDDVLISKLGEMAILEQAAELVLDHEYGHIVSDHKLEVIGRPTITLTKLAKGNDLGFKIQVAVFPAFELPDYKKISKETNKVRKEPADVIEKDVDEIITHLRTDYAQQQATNEGKEIKDPKDLVLPEIDQSFISQFGNFKTVEEFKDKIKENLRKERQEKAKEQHRALLSGNLTKSVKAELPAILIEGELKKMKSQFEYNLQSMGTTLEQYLGHIKKTEQELLKEWRPDAEKRVILQIILNKIALEEKLSANAVIMKKEVDHILEQYKDAERSNVESYVETILVNDAVFSFLEQLG